jgi:hypothetical protein
MASEHVPRLQQSGLGDRAPESVQTDIGLHQMLIEDPVHVKMWNVHASRVTAAH